MFLSSTTLRHPERSPQIPLLEHRLVYAGLKESLDGAVNWVKGAFGEESKLRKFVRVITLPARLPFRAAMYPAKKMWGTISTGLEYGQKGIYTVGEAGRTVGKEIVYDSGKPLVKAPFVDVWRTIGANTRDIIKGLFRLPVNILRTPGMMIKSVRESIGNLGHGAWNFATLKGDFWSSMQGLSLRHPLRSTGAVAKSVRQGIGSVLLPPSARAHIQASFEMPWNVAKNTVTAKTQYLSAVYESAKEFREGILMIPGIPARGSALATDHVAKLRAWRAEKIKEKETAEQATAKEILAKEKGKVGAVIPKRKAA